MLVGNRTFKDHPENVALILSIDLFLLLFKEA